MTKRFIASTMLALFSFMNMAQVWANSAGETITYFHSDHLGSPIAATDENGKVKWIREYSAFGEAEANGDKERIGWAGHEYVAEAELSYMGARWYNPELGRFMAPDPAMFVTSNSLSFNRYLYSNNNPYTFYDPDGEFFDLAIEVVSISIGIASAVKNFSQGNIKEGLMDVGGVVVDGVLAAVPGVPGGVGIARNAAKYADEAAAGAGKLAKVCSFAPETLVSTADGLKAIESINIGDQVLSKDEETGDVTYKPVLNVFANNDKDGMTITFINKLGVVETLTTTQKHPFYVKDEGFIAAGELSEGQVLVTGSGYAVAIQSIDKTPLSLLAYNFSVADYHTYFVGESGVWVHNVCEVAKKEGIYEFPDAANGNKPYVGQSSNIPNRLKQHEKAGRLNPGTEKTTEVLGGKTAREVAEHKRIQEYTGGVPARQSPDVSNKVDPIGPKRQHLLE